MSGGDGGLASQAQLVSPMEVTTDASGNVYIWSDNVYGDDGTIRRVACGGTVQTLMHSNPDWGLMVGGGPNELFIIDNESMSLMRWHGSSTSVVATAPELAYGHDPGRASDGSFFFVAYDFIRSQDALYRLGLDGTATAVTPDAALPHINDLVVAPDGDVWLASTQANKVLRVDPTTGQVVTEVENPLIGLSAGSSAGRVSTTVDPSSVAFDSLGNLYVSDQEGHRVLRRAPDGRYTTITGAATMYPPSIAIDGADNLYVADPTMRHWFDHQYDSVRMVEGRGRAEACTSTVPQLTSLIYTGDTQAKGEDVHLVALLVDAVGTPVPGKEIHFTVDGGTYPATTDATGTAQVDVSVPGHGKSQLVTVSFDGDEEFAPSQTTTTVWWGKDKG
jgi:hypothetical protein